MSRFAALAGAGLMLVACQSAPTNGTPSDSECVAAPSGSASEAVEVSSEQHDDAEPNDDADPNDDSAQQDDAEPQDALKAPEVNFEHGLAPTITERTLLVAGGGRKAGDANMVTFAYVAFNGNTGERLDSVGYDSPYVQVVVDDSAAMLPGLAAALTCVKAGDRVAAVVPAAEAFGYTGNEEYGIAAGESLVFVVDVVAVAADRADGEPQEHVEGMPRVQIGATGEPQVTIPDSDPPENLEVAVLKQGNGEQVKKSATVTVEYHSVVWGDGETFESTWRLSDPVRRPTTGFLEGIGKALVGQSVGSQILVVVPPELGFGSEGNVAAGISGSDTLVFVIDILAVVQPPTAGSVVVD